MLLRYVRMYAPWILLAVVSGWNDRAGAITGLVAAALFLVQDLRRGHRADSLMLEMSTTVFMVLLTALALAAPDSAVMNYGASMAIGWLALTAWGTVLAGRPFTEGIARRGVSADIAATDLFKRITRTIAIVWAAGFTGTAIVLTFIQHAAPDNTLLLVIAKICGFTIPAVFTARYPEVAQKRYFAELGIDDPPAPAAPTPQQMPHQAMPHQQVPHQPMPHPGAPRAQHHPQAYPNPQHPRPNRY
ncbi:hypothetical protein GCM10023191_070270 [Actinoallomurus oryzae]|uniref:Intracellular septation protein A n=1 Tax=Actinoallomurus oryzae TaxID=502180 RepID=A0ABP8QTI9_9ACTN